MADNYLENRMEELRSGKLRMDIRKAVTKPRKGMWQLPFPSRRALVALGNSSQEPDNSRIADMLVDEFAKLECKVAMFDSDKERGARMAHDKGIRFYNVTNSDNVSNFDDVSNSEKKENPDSYKSDIERSFSDLLHSWRDVDIIICSPGSAKVLLSLWIDHKARFPFPVDYPARMIVVSSTPNPQTNIDCNQIVDDISVTDSNPDPGNLMKSAAGHGIIIRGIAADKDIDPLVACRLCVFMCVQGNESIGDSANFCRPFKV